MTKIDIEEEKACKYKVKLYFASGDLSLLQGLGPLTLWGFHSCCLFFSFQSHVYLCLNRYKDQTEKQSEWNEQEQKVQRFLRNWCLFDTEPSAVLWGIVIANLSALVNCGMTNAWWLLHHPDQGNWATGPGGWGDWGGAGDNNRCKALSACSDRKLASFSNVCWGQWMCKRARE